FDICTPGINEGVGAARYCLIENFAEITRAPMLRSAIIRTSVNAAPHILSRTFGFSPALNISSIINGKEDIGPEDGSHFNAGVVPTRISTGADSPMMRAMASMIPVAIPDKAVGRTTRAMVFHFGTPSA